MYPLAKRGASLNCFIPLQNGVLDGRMHSTHLSVGCALQSHNGNVGSSDTSKRPKTLEVSSNVYSSKSLRLSDGSVDTDSLPCSPELLSPIEHDSSAVHAVDEVLENDTRQLLGTYFRDYTGLSKPKWSESKHLSTMKRVVEDVLAKHRFAFNGMITKLSLDEQEDMAFVSTVARSLFSDGTTNWGRIASLVAFGAAVCQYLKEKKRENCVDLVAQEISTYLLTHQGDWLVKNNSWDGFVEFFRVADPESTVRNTLMAFIGVAGIGATLALLSR